MVRTGPTMSAGAAASMPLLEHCGQRADGASAGNSAPQEEHFEASGIDWASSEGTTTTTPKLTARASLEYEPTFDLGTGNNSALRSNGKVHLRYFNVSGRAFNYRAALGKSRLRI